MAIKTDLAIRRGDTLEFSLEVVDENDVKVNITGYKLQFMVKKSTDDADADAILNTLITSFTDPTNGKTVFSIPASTTAALATGSFVYAYQVIDGSGNVAESDSGQCIVTGDVIRATS